MSGDLESLAAGSPPVALLTMREVAERLRVSRSYAYAMVRAGRLPVVRLGPRAIRVDAAVLDRWLAAHQWRGAGMSDSSRAR